MLQALSHQYPIELTEMQLSDCLLAAILSTCDDLVLFWLNLNSVLAPEQINRRDWLAFLNESLLQYS